jgi:hypothetical protein
MSLHAYVQGLHSNRLGVPDDALTPVFYRRLEERICQDPDYARHRQKGLNAAELLEYQKRIRIYAQETTRS